MSSGSSSCATLPRRSLTKAGLAGLKVRETRPGPPKHLRASHLTCALTSSPTGACEILECMAFQYGLYRTKSGSERQYIGRQQRYRISTVILECDSTFAASGDITRGTDKTCRFVQVLVIDH